MTDETPAFDTPLTLPQMQQAAEDQPQPSTEADGSANPFEGGTGTTKVFDDITDPVDFSLLDTEITEALGSGVQLALRIPDPDQPISADNSATLFVLADADFDGRTVRGVLNSHAVIAPAEPETAPVDSDALATAMESLRSGDTLDLEAVTLLLRNQLA